MDPTRLADASTTGDLRYFTMILLGAGLTAAILLIVWLVKERLRRAERERELIGKRLGDGVARFSSLEKCVTDVQANYIHRASCEAIRDKRDEGREKLEHSIDQMVDVQNEMDRKIVGMCSRMETGFKTLSEMLSAHVVVREP